MKKIILALVLVSQSYAGVVCTTDDVNITNTKLVADFGDGVESFEINVDKKYRTIKESMILFKNFMNIVSSTNPIADVEKPLLATEASLVKSIQISEVKSRDVDFSGALLLKYMAKSKAVATFLVIDGSYVARCIE